MTVRPTTPSDLDRVLPLIVPDPATGLTADTYRTRLADGEYRTDWTWVAEDAPGGPPLALAVWWGDPDGDLPDALDAVFVHDSVRSAADRTDLAAQLLTAAHTAYAGAGADAAPEYHLVLPGDWRDRPETVAAVAWRREAARRAGLPVGLERLRYEWTPPAGLPEPSGRLLLQPEPDDEVFVDLFRRVLVGTLDTDSRKEAERLGAEAQARADVAFYRDTMLGDRSWWRIARTPDGEPVGFGIPSRNHAFPVVGYLGVVPEHRGRRYGDDILAEITRILAAETAPERVRADTDLVNAPMAAAFDRLGYRNDTRRLVLSPH
ncbi:GNAT family N-acetyltransferase [Kitasatospora sp. A2-31]|uniref:GNAT family N-acetyltransferase n=1 Tax=Kitasatospora sp. A2-31 TaxID=2916414 RepID=UPI001EEC1271|nr:GNAT family N-acetyltransferase [Kitasatospora sp. A2-31]MCG6498028.1 GNAT family N-acetyltransferase [Kitasatospora sp. A2-31]